MHRLTITILMAAITFSVATAQEQKFSITLNNTGKDAKTDVPEVVTLNDVKGHAFTVKSATVSSEGKELPCQLDDLDNDGKADELVFVYDIAPKSSKTFDITLSAKYAGSQQGTRVYADMMLNDKKGKHPLITALEAPGDSYIYSDLYHHGAAFESEFTAYRIYFDHRQNIDIFGKKTYRLELKDTGFYTSEKQLSEGYGNDVLWAGQSVGCGTLKLWNGASPQNWTDVRLRGQRIIAAGPVRNIIEVYDLGVKVDVEENPYDVTAVYTQYAGHREVRVDITLDRPMNTPFLCTGVQKIGTSEEAQNSNGGIRQEGFVTENGIAASWGADFPEMGKKDIFPPEAVGLAVKVPRQYVATTSTDDLNYLVVLGKPGIQTLHYYVTFGAAKEINGCHNAQEWFKYVEDKAFENLD